MNAERLHVIAIAIYEEFTSIKMAKLLGQLVSNLQNQVSQPNQPEHQNNVAKILHTLYESLDKAPSNDMSPAWKQALEEIDAQPILGRNLKNALQSIFERNQITTAVALEEVKLLHAKAQEIQAALQQLIASLKTLRIGAEELKSGETELGIIVPRNYVNNKLDSFGAELKELDAILETFAELATGSRPGFKIRSISSSELGVFLDLLPEIAACIAIAVERIVALYKQLLEIRKLHQDMQDQGVPREQLKGVEDHADNLMNSGIEKLSEELLDRYFNGDEDRRHELNTALRIALKKIANRVDRGFNIEIRVEPQTTDDEGTPLSPEDETHIEVIQSASRNLQFMKLEGDPILSLPENNEANEQADNEEENSSN